MQRIKSIRIKNWVKILLLICLPIIISIGVITDNWKAEKVITEERQSSVSVKKFGAIGDGVTNDTDAFQAALNYSSNKKKLILPKGIYVIDFLTFPKNVKLEGEKGSMIVASEKTYSRFISLSGKNIEIRNIKISGENRRSIALSIVSGSQNVIVESCTISNINSTEPETTAGIKVEGNTKNVFMRNNTIDGIGNTPNGKVGDNSGASRGIWIGKESTEVEPENIVIEKNVIRNIQTREDGDGISVQGWSGNVHVIIMNNFFEFCSKRAIKIMSPGVLIKRNKIMNNYTHASDYEKVMYSFISIYASDVIVEENQMLGGNSYHGIDIGTDLIKTPKRINVKNNVIVLSENGVKTFLGGIVLYTNVEEVYLSGNTIKNSNNGIILRKKIKGCIITSNYITNVSERGIFISNVEYKNISDVEILNNYIYSMKEAILLQAGESVVKGNSGRTGSNEWSFISISGTAEVRLQGDLRIFN